MKIAGIDFPRPILDALRNGRLVVFAGAGVSMGEPASLPDFRTLAESIAQGTGELKCSKESEDQFLGRLQNKGVQVHTRAADELSKHNSQPNNLHLDLLRLFPDPASVRIVTTNFDLLFEGAAEQLFKCPPDEYAAPALPLGRKFNGIVHVHGVLDREDEMVLTDSDFGRAYLTEGWARRFLVDLFQSYTVVFVGYSHNDTVMNYLARALPTGTERFALTGATTSGRWQTLDITPVIYSQESSRDHGSLLFGVGGLARYARRGVLGWEREITEIARNLPPIDDEASDIVHDALTDPVRTRFFTAAASHVEWIGWLERNRHLDNLISDSAEDITEQDRLLAKWLAERFAHDHADYLFHLIARRNLQMHRELWLPLANAIGYAQDQALAPKDLARWVSILIATAPPRLWLGHARFTLRSLGQRCAAAGLLDSLLELFTIMIEGHLEVRSTSLPVGDSGTDTELFLSPNVKLDFDHSDLDSFWKLRLKPVLEQIAEPLLDIVVESLVSQFRTLVLQRRLS